MRWVNDITTMLPQLKFSYGRMHPTIAAIEIFVGTNATPTIAAIEIFVGTNATRNYRIEIFVGTNAPHNYRIEIFVGADIIRPKTQKKEPRDL